MWHAWIPFWRPGLSPCAGDVDLLFAGLLLASSLVLRLLFLLLTLFCVRYRAGALADRTDRITKRWRWEVGWTSASLLCFLLLFVWEASVFFEIYKTPQSKLSARGAKQPKVHRTAS